MGGFYEYLKPGNSFGDLIKSGKDFFLMEAGRMTLKGISSGFVSYLAVNAEAIAVRMFMNKIFTFPWNFLKRK